MKAHALDSATTSHATGSHAAVRAAAGSRAAGAGGRSGVSAAEGWGRGEPDIRAPIVVGMNPVWRRRGRGGAGRQWT